MKFALFFACGLLSVQALYGASVAKAFDDEASEWGKDLAEEDIVGFLSDLDLYRADDSRLFGNTFLSPIGCISAVKDVGKLGLTGWEYVQKRIGLHKKAKNERKNCEKLTNAEKKKSCLEKVNEIHDEEKLNLWKLILEAAPGIADIVIDILKCVL